MDDEGYARGDDDEDSVSDIPRSIWNALAPFQKYGVSWIVRNNGRALLADEPGLGKAILLSGMPALSRPMEVFWQLHALDDKQWTDPADFNKRYCSGRRKKDDPKDTNEDGEKKKEYSAASNLEELHTLLRATLMLRRNKASIL